MPPATGTISNLAVILTERCNLACPYCYRGGGGARDLPEKVLAETLARVWEASRPPREVVFSGGEPTLRFGVLRRAVRALRAAAAPDCGLTIRLITNGTRLNEDRLAFLVENGVELNLSLDGSPEAQQVRGEWTVSRLERLLGLMRSRHPEYLARKTRVVMTLQPTTAPLLADSVDGLIGAGVRQIGVSLVLTPVPGWDDDLRPLLAEQLTRVRRSCESALAATGEVPFLALRRYHTEPETSDGTARSCAIDAGTSLVLDTDGGLYSCLMFAPSGLRGAGTESLLAVSARIRVDAPAAAADAATARRLAAAIAGVPAFGAPAERHSRLGRCADCAARATCRICPFALLRFAGNPRCTRVPAFLCAYQLEMARQHARMPVQEARGAARYHPAVIEARRRRLAADLRRLSLPADR